MNNRFGIHWSNVPAGQQLGKWALGMGGDCYLVMDGAHGWIPRIREARPNAIIVHRHAVHNWMDMEPEEWAVEMAKLFREYQQYTEHVELECEPDIFPNFPGWGQPIIDRLKFAAEWNIKVAEHLSDLCPTAMIHSPPLAHERIDLPQWFKIWKPVLDVCDVLDMHCYWEKDGKYYRPGLYDPEESYHRAFRYRKIHKFLTEQNYHIPMMVTECGNFAPNIMAYADELIYYFSELEKDADYMIGGCVFILKSNIHNWVNDLTRQPKVERFFRRLGEAPKRDLPYPSGSGGGSVRIPEWLTDIKDSLERHATKKYATRELSKIDTIVVHHTATIRATPEGIARYHVRTRGWPGAAYHIYIRKDGSAYLMNSLETISYHCHKHNHHTIGVAFEGDFTREAPTPKQVVGGDAVFGWLEGILGRKKIVGHKEMPDSSTACPGRLMDAFGPEPEPEPEPDCQSVLNKAGAIKQLAESIEDEVLEWKK